MKIFISLPMNGRGREEIVEETRQIFASVKENFPDAELIDSIISDKPSESVKTLGAWYLGRSILLLAEADIAVFGDGWQDARGCNLEHSIAEAYGITCYER